VINRERAFAVEVVQRLVDAGHQALWAGGCVRDELLGLIPKDYDVATSATPEQVRSVFRRTVAVGESFGVIEVLGPRIDDKPLKIQVATFRSDGCYIDGRHPEDVVFSTPEEDAQRRDFTINGMFKDPLTGTIIDYVGGQADLQAQVLRAIGDVHARFREDKLRMIRAVRMAARFELTIDPDTEAAIKQMAAMIRVISAERIADEFRKLLVDQHRVRAMRLFVDVGLAATVLPELLPMMTLPQGSPLAPTGTLWEHTLRVLECLPGKPTFELAFAALLHDVGKPRTVGRTPDRYTFYNHEHVGCEMAHAIADRLKLSNDERARITWLVDKHQFLADVFTMRTCKVKTTLVHPGIRELLDLHRADALAWGRSAEHVEYCERLLTEWTQEELSPPPLLTGHDLTRLGLKPGPLFKKLLDAVRETQLDGTIKSTKQALELVEKMLVSEAVKDA